MNISNVRRGGGRPVIAWFDLEIEPGIRIYGIELKRNQTGELRIFAPGTGERKVVTFAPVLADRIIKLAEATLEQMQHGNYRAA